MRPRLQQPDVRRTTAKLARILFGSVAIVFLVLAFRETLHRSRGLSLPDWPHLALAALLQLTAVAFAALGWAYLFDGRSRWLLARGYFASQPAKYIPGAIWQPIGQVKLAADAGVTLGPATVSFLVHAGIQVIAGGSLGALLVLSHGLTRGVRLLPLLGLVPLLMLQRSRLVQIIRASERWTRRSLGSGSVPGQAALLRSFGWSVASLGAAGLAFAVLLSSVAPPAVDVSILVAAPAFALAWAVGFVAIPFPAGLGVREGVLIGVLSSLVGAAPVIAASVFHRLVAMVVELLLFAASRAPRGAPTYSIKPPFPTGPREEGKAENMSTPPTKPPILVTGSHRSGTTWVGAMLCLSEEAAYIDEPFNPGRRPGWAPRPFPFWYQYICRDNEEPYLPVFRDIVSLRYRVASQLGQIRSLEHVKRAAGDWAHSIRCRRKQMRPLIKDAIAFMSAQWLADRFGARVVLMVRHPAAFAGSIKRLNWRFDFGTWLRQDLLMRDLLGPFGDQMRDFDYEKRDIIDQAILMWNAMYSVVHHYREVNPDWLVVRYEDLAESPADGFRWLYEELGLTWSEKVRALVADHTGTWNVKEVAPEAVGGIRRDSRAARQTWWTRLTPEEIERVRAGVAEVSPWFYADTDWDRSRARTSG